MSDTSRVLCECGYEASFMLRPVYNKVDEPWIETIPPRKRSIYEALCFKPKAEPKKLLRRYEVDHKVPAYDLEDREITAVPAKEILGSERFKKIPPETWNVLVQAEAREICGVSSDKPQPANTLICPKCGSNNIWLAPSNGPSVHMTFGHPDYMKPTFIDECYKDFLSKKARPTIPEVGENRLAEKLVSGFRKST